VSIDDRIVTDLVNNRVDFVTTVPCKHMLDDQPTNFYMLGTKGLSSSIGLGVALAQKQTVISIDGDGSVLKMRVGKRQSSRHTDGSSCYQGSVHA